MSDTDSNLTLDTQTLLDIKNVKTVLEMIPRRVENGCIVKIRREVLFEPLTHQQSLSYPHIYGIVTNLEEVCPHSGQRAYEMRWFLFTSPFYQGIMTTAILAHNLKQTC